MGVLLRTRAGTDNGEKWHFRLVIESLPAVLQLALLLLGCTLSRYLWTTSRTVAGVVITFIGKMWETFYPLRLVRLLIKPCKALKSGWNLSTLRVTHNQIT